MTCSWIEVDLMKTGTFLIQIMTHQLFLLDSFFQWHVEYNSLVVIGLTFFSDAAPFYAFSASTECCTQSGNRGTLHLWIATVISHKPIDNLDLGKKLSAIKMSLVNIHQTTAKMVDNDCDRSVVQN